ncbi:MAG: sensor histidine kinase [Spirochaetota bacterium]
MSEPGNSTDAQQLWPAGLLDHAPYGVVVLDDSGRIQAWNAQIATWTGLQAGEVADLPIDRVFPEFERPRYRMRLDTLADQGTPVVFHGTVNRGLLRMRSGSFSLPHYRVTCRRRDVSGGTVLWIENATLLQETIDYLREEIGARRRAEEELRGALDSRDVLYRELQHRVKNSLSLISSLVSLAQSEVSDETAEASLRDIRARVDSIGLVYEQLSGGGAYGEVDLGLYLTRLLDTLSASIGWPSRVQEPRTAFDSCAVPVDTAVCIGLIVNELVTNAVKHAFPDGREGSIEVTLSSGDGMCDLRIVDDGVGATAASGDGDGKRLGLGIVELLADQIGGALERSTGPGTAYRLRFRLDAVPTIADGEENAAPDGYSRSNT